MNKTKEIVILALLALWIPLNLAFEHLMFAIVSLFAGFIIGGIPGLVDEIKTEKVKPTYIIALVISMLIVAFVGVASSLFGLDVSSMFVSPYPIYLYFILTFSRRRFLIFAFFWVSCYHKY